MTREELAEQTKIMYSIQEYDWDNFPYQMKLSLMIDTALIFITRATIENETKL
jgi:hypothetical protein